MPDVNGTKYHLMRGKSDWATVSAHPDLNWEGQSNGIQLSAIPFQFPTGLPTDQVLTIADRRGSAADRFGNWYWISDDRSEILTLAAGSNSDRAQRFWSHLSKIKALPADTTFKDATTAGQATPFQFGGLTVTSHHYLVVGVVSEPLLLVFDLFAGTPPLILCWPSDRNFLPYDLAAMPDGGVAILSRPLDSMEPLLFTPHIWLLDRCFQLIEQQDNGSPPIDNPSADFKSIGEAPALIGIPDFPDAILLETTDSPANPVYAVAIEALPDHSILVLSSGEENNTSPPCSSIYRLSKGRLDIENGVTLNQELNLCGHDMTVEARQSPLSIEGVVYVADINGNQSYAYSLLAGKETLKIELQGRFFPMRLFSGKGLVKTVDGIYYDNQKRWLPLTEKRQPRYRKQAAVVLEPFDCELHNCTWHRLILDGCLPPDTGIVIESRSDNRADLLESQVWQREPHLYQRHAGNEFPFPSRSEKHRRGDGSWELLFQNAKGRYLQLRLTLYGNGRITPTLQTLRVYFPRFSYLNEYLPKIYRDDSGSASFLDRFLANIEGFFSEWEGSIANMQRLADTRIIPAEFLEWLASWLGASLDTSWDDARKRLFLRHAISLYNQRGTIQGILNAISFAIAPCPEEVVVNRAANLPRLPRGQTLATAQIFGPRIVERFAKTPIPRLALNDLSFEKKPGILDETAPWKPKNGLPLLMTQFQDFLTAQYTGYGTDALADLNSNWETHFSSWKEIAFSPTLPEGNAVRRQDWRRFVNDELGFEYAEVTSDDWRHYSHFLQQRYRRIDELNEAYEEYRSWSGFEEVRIPDKFPEAATPLIDWLHFASVYLPRVHAAHHFTVLLPTTPGETLESQQERERRVTQIVDIEKPAHTSFDIVFYWAMFRIGEARLGFETQIAEGNRYTALQLGHQKLSESILRPSAYPWSVDTRRVIDRDSLFGN